MPKEHVNILAGRNFESEFVFSASRSSGPGGQHVNKVSTKIELRFDIPASQLLYDYEKLVVLEKLASRLTKDGILRIVSQSERSQFENKTRVVEKFYSLLEKALTPAKKRKATRPTASSKTKRLNTKHIVAKKKALRKPAVED